MSAVFAVFALAAVATVAGAEEIDIAKFDPNMSVAEQKGSDLIATVNYHTKETWQQQTE